MTLIATPEDPVPEGAVVEWLTAADGTRLRVARWCPPEGSKGTVVLLSGRSEFIEKYFEVIGWMLTRGFSVATLDWRGQGLSDRPLANPHKGHVAHFDLYMADLRQVLESFVLPHCPAPYRLVCHSMGGNIGLRYLGTDPDTFESALFSAPMWGIGKPPRTTNAVRALAAATKFLRLGAGYVPGTGGDWTPGGYPFEGNTLTNDRARFERAAAQVEAEPRLALGGPTLGWVAQAIASMDVLHSDGFAEAIEIPIVVCSAAQDALVSLGSHELIVGRLPNVKHLVLDGARHELLMEIDDHRNRVLAEFDAL